MAKALLNASNLHFGGGVQVATSVFTELASLGKLPEGLSFWASSEIDENLRRAGIDVSKLPAYEVVNTYGLRLFFSPIVSRIKSFDCVLTIFGPLYAFPMKSFSIVGFAQPWIIYPDNDFARQQSWSKRMMQRLKYWLQARFFSRANLLLVELEHVRNGLVRRGIADMGRVHVVHNTLASLYSEPKSWQTLSVPTVHSDLRLGFLGRNYPHKNTKIFPDVHRAIRLHHGIDVRFYVTFTSEEWDACSAEFRDCSINVGPLPVTQCPAFYLAMDGVIFPSLLECFSATPLEAMAMERPLFASDRTFIRDVCANHAHYFDPLDHRSVADCIATYYKSSTQKTEELLSARRHALEFSSPADRAKRYLTLLCEVAGIQLPIENNTNVL